MQRTTRYIISFDSDFADLALEELLAADPQARVEGSLTPGVDLVQGQRSFSNVAAAWRNSPPAFLRHVCPIHAELELHGEAGDLEALNAALTDVILAQVEAGRTFSVQSRLLADTAYKPFDVNNLLAATVAATGAATLDVRNPQQVISVVCAGPAAGGAGNGATLRGFIGISAVQDNISDWAGGLRRFARDPKQVSRSEFKLLEALEVFAIDLPERGVALDLGASPGGWTRILREREQYVTAVDPGSLHPSIAADKGVRHLRMTAEAYLTAEPDTFDIIVNDMRMDGRDSARLMVEYAACLYAHGIVVMTVKLPERKRRAVIDHALHILTEAYEIAGMKQLFHNRSEVTLYLRRKPQWRAHADGDTDDATEALDGAQGEA